MLTSSEEDYFLDDSQIQENLEDAVLKEALKSGVDLREYSKQVEDELRAVENKSIEDYIRESQNIASLHNQIVECDDILMRMENMLQEFQSDLGSISNEIISLQQQSVDMNMKLRNRQSVRGELSQFVSDLVVPESMIKTILHTPVTEVDFLEQLQNLEHKINFLKEQSFREARSCSDVKDTVDKLKIASISKIREFLLDRINQFKKPMANYQIPQNVMLKFRFYYKFLMANNREVAKEIKEEYVDTMSKVLFSYFKSYSGRLSKLQYGDLATRDDLLGSDDSKQARFAGPTFLFASKPNLKNKATVFSVGSRDEVLTNSLEMPILVPHHSNQKNETKYPFEVLFRSEQFALVENGCREYLFLVEFFMVQSDSAAATDMFNSVIGKTLQYLIKQLDQYCQESYDGIALFLCVHLVHKYRILCHKRAVAAIDQYWDKIHGLLWYRLMRVFDMNIQSIKECDPNRLKPLDLRPHYITRRYAEFSAAFISINDHFPDNEVNRLLGQLQSEADNLITKMSSVFPQRKEQLIFLINNYDIIMSILSERIHSESRESDGFHEQMNARISEYITMVLNPRFGMLIEFLNQAEPLMENNEVKRILDQEKAILNIIQSFNSEWKKSLDDINSEVFSAFPNLKNGTNILQQILTTFVQYYHRFHKIISLPIFSNSSCRTQLMNVHQLMVEVKKFKPQF